MLLIKIFLFMMIYSSTIHQHLLHDILVFLCLLNHLSSFLPLLFKYLFSLFDIFFFFRNPHFEFLSFQVIGPRRELFALIHLLNVFWLSLLSIFDCFFSHSKHLWIHIHIELIWVHFRLELLERMSLKHISTRTTFFSLGSFILLMLLIIFHWELS